MIELIVNNEAFELLGKADDIKYSKQIADIFDIAAVSNSYTNSFTIPKTPKNTRLMEQLGIAGDTSNVPYSKLQVTLNDNGFPIVPRGWLRVKSTSDEYKVSIIDGMVDFFKTIANKTLGADIDLSAFDHEKNIASVVASFDNEFYKYIIADYNGKNYAKVDDEVGINIDYLVPCFNVGKLFELVMTTFGFTYSKNNIEELDELYITYPKPPAENITDQLYAEMYKGNYTIYNPYYTSDWWVYPYQQQFWATSTIIQGELVNNWKYRIPKDFSYRIDTDIEAYILYARFDPLQGWVQPVYGLAYHQVLKNGEVINSYFTDPFEPKSSSVSVFCLEGDIIEVRLRAPLFLGEGFQAIQISHNSEHVKIYKTNQGQIVLSDAFKDFNIKDFVKECFWYCAVTPLLDVVNSSMSFVSLEERLDFSRAVDWTKCFKERTDENYDSGMAQKNAFTHKYNDPDDKAMNGYLYVDDMNAPIEKDIIESKTYAPEQIRTFFEDVGGTEDFNTYKFTIWQRETKEDADGVMTLEYKGLNQRFYFMKIRMSEESEWRLLSETVLGSEIVSVLPYADTTGTTYNQIVPNKYARYLNVINSFREHKIDLVMGLLDYLSADLTCPVFFGQESQYYLLNKLNYRNGQISDGEFVRINKFEAAELQSIDIQLFTTSQTQVRFRIPIIDGYDSMIEEDSLVTINGVPMEFSNITVTDTFIQAFVNIPFEDQEVTPTVNSFSIRTSNGAEARFNTYTGDPVTWTFNELSYYITKIATAYIS